jgi:peptidoglycan/LPS O-acetylase OafA/YrhL
LINLRSLDALRGILAAYVVIHHSRWLLWAGHSAWIQMPHPAWANALAYSSAVFRYGHEAVMVFFALSGFFIHLRTAKKLAAGGMPQMDISQFYARRAHRLLAPYLAALAVTFALDMLGRHFFPALYSARTGDSLIDDLFSRKDYSAAAVLPAFCLLPASLGHDFGTNGPLWSLAYEVVYYLLYPFWNLLRLRSGFLAYVAAPAICLGLALVPASGFPVSVLTLYPIWLAGAGLAELFCRGLVPQWSALAAAAAFAGAFVLHHVAHTPAAGVLVNAILGVSAAWCFALLPLSCVEHGWHRVLEYLGIRSYTIYIVHFPIIVVISSWAFTTRGGLPQSGWLAIAGTFVTLVLCIVVFELCEKHFLHERIRAEGAGG